MRLVLANPAAAVDGQLGGGEGEIRGLERIKRREEQTNPSMF